MLWIGLTGGIASGKSSVSQLLTDRGRVVIDADLLAREVVQIGAPALTEIAARFGTAILKSDGRLDRKALGHLIFSDPAQREVLEGILHPRIRALAEARRRELSTKGLKLAFYDVPLLFEKKMQAHFDAVVLVTCAREYQLARLMVRDQLSAQQAEARIDAQMPLAEKVKRADYLIDNSGSLMDLKTKVDVVLQALESRR